MKIEVRNAKESDIESIFNLLEYYAKQKIVLSRTPSDIAFYLQNFVVAECDNKVLGCCAARDFGNNLYEVRSLAVLPECLGKGIGRAMTEFIEKRLSEKLQNWRLFALTLEADFFKKLGYDIVDKELFPQKIWSDCKQCLKKECCDEIAVLKEKSNG